MKYKGARVRSMAARKLRRTNDAQRKGQAGRERQHIWFSHRGKMGGLTKGDFQFFRKQKNDQCRRAEKHARPQSHPHGAARIFVVAGIGAKGLCDKRRHSHGRAKPQQKHCVVDNKTKRGAGEIIGAEAPDHQYVNGVYRKLDELGRGHGKTQSHEREKFAPPGRKSGARRSDLPFEHFSYNNHQSAFGGKRDVARAGGK